MPKCGGACHRLDNAFLVHNSDTKTTAAIEIDSAIQIFDYTLMCTDVCSTIIMNVHSAEMCYGISGRIRAMTLTSSHSAPATRASPVSILN